MAIYNVKEFVTDEGSICLVTEKFSTRNTDKLSWNNWNSRK
jgi:hypothetical protein